MKMGENNKVVKPVAKMLAPGWTRPNSRSTAVLLSTEPHVLRALFLGLSVLVLLCSSMANAAIRPGDPPRPLFRSDDIIDIDLLIPDLRTLIRLAPKSVEPRAMQLRYRYEGETYLLNGNVQARGNARRDPSVCSFPPLRLIFEQKLRKVPLFTGHKKIKLVTHCQRKARFEQLMLREYTAYKMMNEISPVSLRVRLVRINYYKGRQTSPSMTRLGFFIEDIDDLAKRHGLREYDTGAIKATTLEKETATLFALFQYLIANLDYSPNLPKIGNTCCHNVKLLLPYSLTEAKTNSVVPVAYDFDYSGFVDAPYAINHGDIPISSRLFRGVCAYNDTVNQYRERLLTLEERLFEVIAAVPETTDKNRETMRAFLTKSLTLLASPTFLEQTAIHCIS
ncbi:hypothetical protein LJ739_08665 [Aestuariibacter halophilus]|uniref:Uncharacterized protein n=1 Tax=Fluctibacter halophilus TaxID=226011 RepID=A0ABS8G6Y2_9ALTE|nr:hypothetical protein [Aestuariibacter halophilus]MCC2616310.1 hypothetical protein [Aestuariibacter halophilus]